MIYTRKSAFEFLEQFSPDFIRLGWGLALAGGLTTKQTSENDMDFIVFRLKEKESGKVDVLPLLQFLEPFDIRGVVDNRPQHDTKAVLKIKVFGYRIDLIFPTVTVEEFKGVKVLVRQPDNKYFNHR